jgi:hypothetical protein
MIGLEHKRSPKPSSYSWAVSLFICRALHPGESSLACVAENKNGRLAWKVHVGRPFGVPLDMRLFNWVYIASFLGFICGLDTDTLIGVSAWMWGLFGKRLSAFCAKELFPFPMCCFGFRTCLDLGMVLFAMDLILF